jgi:hypothetical protein
VAHNVLLIIVETLDWEDGRRYAFYHNLLLNGGEGEEEIVWVEFFPIWNLAASGTSRSDI